MFELPNAKRIRRSDLYSPLSSPSPSPDPAAIARLQSHFQDLDTLPPQQQSEPVATTPPLLQAESPAPSAYAFRLFAARPAPENVNSGPPDAGDSITNQVSHIVLHSPTPEGYEAGFVQPRRRDSYYFTGNIGAGQRARFEEVALSGQDVLAQLHVKWPGCALPWRVTTIPPSRAPCQPSDGLERLSDTSKITATNTLNPLPTTITFADGNSPCKRPGKKRRLAIRTKFRRASEAKVRHAKERAEKEKEEQEKRTRRNREKKVKRREKERVRKREAGAAILDSTQTLNNAT